MISQRLRLSHHSADEKEIILSHLSARVINTNPTLQRLSELFGDPQEAIYGTAVLEEKLMELLHAQDETLLSIGRALYEQWANRLSSDCTDGFVKTILRQQDEDSGNALWPARNDLIASALLPHAGDAAKMLVLDYFHALLVSRNTAGPRGLIDGSAQFTKEQAATESERVMDLLDLPNPSANDRPRVEVILAFRGSAPAKTVLRNLCSYAAEALAAGKDVATEEMGHHILGTLGRVYAENTKAFIRTYLIQRAEASKGDPERLSRFLATIDIIKKQHSGGGLWDNLEKLGNLANPG